MEKFYAEMAKILEVEEVKPDDALRDFKLWDSLTELSVLAMIDASFGVNLTGDHVDGVKTVGELWAVVESKR